MLIKTKSSPMRWLKGQMMKRMHGMITCREFEDFILRYLDGELTPKQSRVFRMHIRLCRECREYLDAYQRTMEISQSLLIDPHKDPHNDTKNEIPVDVPEDLIKAVLLAKKS